MASWPATFPAPLHGGYQLTPGEQSRRTDMESGAPRARRITYARNDKINAEWVLTDTQMAAFRTWFEDDAEAAGGSAWFDITLKTGSGGSTSVEARMSTFQCAPVSDKLWRVTATLEVR